MADKEVMKVCCEGGTPCAVDKEPIGQINNLADLPCYEVGQGTKAVISVYDIFGFNVKRTRVVCDQIAQAGFTVIMPDFFRGDDVLKEFGSFPPPGGFEDLMKWLEKYPLEKAVKELMEIVIPHLKAKGVEKVGIVGFCWGGKVTVLSSASSEISAGVGLHPSFLKVEDVPPIQCPQMFLPAGNDPPIEPVWDAMKSKPFFDKCVVKTFTDMVHGWTVRRDPDDKKAVEQADEAINMAIDFFKAHL